MDNHGTWKFTHDFKIVFVKNKHCNTLKKIFNIKTSALVYFIFIYIQYFV